MKDNNNIQDTEENIQEVQQELSKVATNPKKNILIMVVICLVIAYVVYYFFLSGTEPQKKQDTPVALPGDISRPVQVNPNDIPSIPTLPDPPKLVEPPSPPPIPVQQPPEEISTPTSNLQLPTPVVETPATPLPPPPGGLLPQTGGSLASGLAMSEEEKKRKEAKWKANIILIAGVPPQKTPEEVEQEANFKERGNLELLLGRGKVIDAVLETAINSDFGGEVRAVVSRDIFSESGRVILIPKGSRVFGEYNTGIEGEYARVSINWTRVDLASGYSLQFIGTGIDALGRKGTDGRLDNKYKEKLANTVLMSAFNITLANTLDKITPPVQSSTAATQNQAAATQLNNTALAIFNDTTYSPATKIQLICTQVQAAIPDKTSAAYTAFVAACNNITTNPGSATPEQNLTSIMAAVNTAATGLLTQTDQQITPTQAQEASKQAFTDITNTVKDMLKQEQFKPTMTVDQGTAIKIYVTKDYNFPQKAINKKRTR